jgi:hypothetical protein
MEQANEMVMDRSESESASFALAGGVGTSMVE